MRSLSAAFALATALLGFTVAASDVVVLDSKNFDEIVLKSEVPTLVEFYAPWCGHCKTLAPTYEELATKFAGSKQKVRIAKMDADQKANKKIAQKYGVSGFPTLKWFDIKTSGKGGPEDYKGGRDIESLSSFISEKTGIKSKVKAKLPDAVVALTDSNFDEIVMEKGKDVLVEFYAPWCGHCKTLKPIYEKVAQNFKGESNVILAAHDADSPGGKKMAEKYGVQGFPTLKFFPAKSKTTEGPIDYAVGRTEDAITGFLNQNAGTFRKVGGGLNDLAGRIPSVDEILIPIAAQATATYDAVLTALESVGKTAEAKAVSYYKKVAEKAAANKAYLEKEATRLEGILKKGAALGEDKKDDLTRRLNVLNVFRGKFAAQEKEAEPSAAEKDEL